jgi:hypothetical protein
MIFAVPPEGMSVSGELTGMSRTIIPFIIKAPEAEKIPEVLAKQPEKGPGEAGKAHVGDSGKMGDRNSKKPSGAYSVRGDGRDMHTGQADAAADVLNKGILPILGAAMSSRFADIFGRGSAVGDAQEEVMGNLIAANIDNGYGAGGFGILGSGNGGAGTGWTTIGTGNFNTLGGRGYGHDPGTGGLGPRTAHKVPSITTGIVTARGSLDKEIIRRVVHLHMNEVKYCYDQELVRKAGLEGRLSVQFVISPMGQVLSSVMQSTTMNDVRVEKCVVDAVKRWEFPKPVGGGIAIVSYPFNFVAGSGS